MQSEATTPDAYIASLSDDKKKALTDLRNIIIKNLPEGFIEVMSYGIIGYVVPHTLYPNGYHCDSRQPLPFMSLASQKNFVAIYHLGLYTNDALLNWFKSEYSSRCTTKLDMGKSCIRFKKTEQIPLELIGQLASRITPQEWIELYESTIRK